MATTPKKGFMPSGTSGLMNTGKAKSGYTTFNDVSSRRNWKRSRLLRMAKEYGIQVRDIGEGRQQFYATSDAGRRMLAQYYGNVQSGVKPKKTPRVTKPKVKPGYPTR